MGRSAPPPGRRRTPLELAAGLVARRPRLVILVWFVLLGILAGRGSGLEQKISISPIFVEGSEAERAHTISLREFGSDSTLIVMLRGPQAAVNRQGRTLAEDLEAMPNTLVNSPWGSGQTIGGLRPQPGVGALVVSVGESTGSGSDTPVRQVEREIQGTVSRPVHSSIAGGLVLSDALSSAASSASTTAERLAIPVLLIVLLLVCRSFLAALMPLVVGAMVVGATKGVLELCAGLVRMDSFALGAAGMFGLALGVDYSLLVVSRFREEQERGGELGAVVERTVLASGRSIIPAGCGLVLAMLVATLVLPSAVISSVALSVIVASVLSVLSAIFTTPSILMVLGKHLDRWSLPRRRHRAGRAPRWTQRLSRRPALVLGVVFALFLSGVWALTLQTRIGTVVELPSDNSSRLQQEDIQHTLGEGWVAPLEVVMNVNDDGPVTTPKRLAALTTFQRRVEADPGVATMAGFSPVHRATEQFARLGPGLHAQQRGLVRLGKGVSAVKSGAVASTNGLFSAQEGAQQIDSAIGATRTGSGRLAAGLKSTAKGSEKLNGGLTRVGTGSGKLTDGATRSSDGASRLAKALGKAAEQAGEVSGSSRVLKNALTTGEQSLTGLPEAVQNSEERLIAAQQALQRMTTGRGDPQYAAAVAAVEEASRGLGGSGEESEGSGVKGGIEHAQSQFSLGLYLAAREAKNGRKSEKGITKLAKSANRLDHGLHRLAASSQDVSDGIAELSKGGEGLSPGLRKLTSSAERLAGGLGEIGAGAEELVGGIGQGAQKSTKLSSALRQIGFGVRRLQGPGGEGQFHQLDVQSPGLFKSGYFYLAGLVGSKDKRRQQIGYLMNLGDGASTARMLVVPRDGLDTSGSEETQDRLHQQAARLEKEADAEVLIGGVAPAVTDLNTELRDEALLARLALSLVTIVVLLFVTRSLVLPLIAAALNLLTVSATFGLLALFFNGSLLGGPGYVDTVIVPASIILIFGLAIDYEVFIFARIREEYLRTGSTSEAISRGVGQSAKVVTGAALIMISVFLAFAVSPLATLRVSGVALAIAVFIDAFLVRFVILPATMRALGDRSWWMPRWLDRVLPGGGPVALVAEER